MCKQTKSVHYCECEGFVICVCDMFAVGGALGRITLLRRISTCCNVGEQTMYPGNDLLTLPCLILSFGQEKRVLCHSSVA